MSDQVRIPCVIMRGGTSKGIFLKANDLPQDPGEKNKMLLAIFGSPDARQIDGLAGAEPLTSKLAIIGPPTRPDADVDYTFGQVSITDTLVDYSGNCGNISSAVGPFAIDESMVLATEPVTRVRIHNTNTGKMLFADVQVENGKAKVSGDCAIAGVPGTAAPVQLDFSGTSGAATGKLLPTGKPLEIMETSRGPIEVSIVDLANPCIFVHAKSVGMKGTETPAEVDGNPALLAYLEEIRAKCCVMIGMASSIEDAMQNCRANPLVIFVSEPQDYTNFLTGKTIKKQDVDMLSRLMFMQILHKAHSATGTACTGAAAKIPGTIVNRVIPDIDTITTIRIGHPSGVLPVMAEVENGVAKRASFTRTARRIMEGYVFLEKKRFGLK